MKKIIFAAIAACSFVIADAQLKTPAPSTTQVVKQEFALGNIELSYSRPGMKGRTIFGDLVPYGKVWRTGANQATTLSFSDEVIIGGTKIAPGKYGLLTIPGQGEWTVIISKQTDVTSPADYKQDQDVVRVNVKPETLPFSLETFSIVFGNVKDNSLSLDLLWDKVYVAVPITADVDTKVMGQINNLMNKDNKPYFNAAMYYMTNGKDLNQALAWFDKAAETTPTAFWVHHQRANCLAKLGKKNEAKAAALKSKELATAAKNNDYVALNDKLLKDLGK